MRAKLFLGIIFVQLLVGCSNVSTPVPFLAEEEEFILKEDVEEFLAFEDEFDASLLVEDPGQTPTPTPFQPQEPTQTAIPAKTPTLVPTPTQTFIDEPTPEQITRSIPPNPIPAKKGFPKPAPDFSSAAEGNMINILLIGSDQRGSGSFRTDTMLIASIRPDENSVSLISIPRDLYVYIPSKGMHKINTAYLWGELNKYPGKGPASLKDTIYYNLGVRIDHYVIINFKGFRKVVNSLDGIDVPVACKFTDWHVINPNRSLQSTSNWKLYSIGPGVVHMDGDLALWYARSRLKSSDYDRSRRQQEVLRSLYSRAMKIDVLSQVPDLYRQVVEHVRTDIELADILELVPMALNFNSAKIRSYYITAGMVKPTNINGMYAQLPKTDKIYKMIEKALSPPTKDVVVREAAIVEVCNASGKADWDALAAERLHYAGFKTVACSIPVDEQKDKTAVIVMSQGEDINLTSALLTAFSLPGERVVEMPGPEPQATYRMILGKDFDPCFSPYKLTH